jgi:Fe-S-cluster containining protein
MKEKWGPCIEKECHFCCKPVKVRRFFPDENIPVDKEGNKIWIENNELLAPEKHPDSIRLRSFECLKLNEKGKCGIYEDRPQICRNTSCIESNSDEGTDEQHKRFVNEKFFKIPIKKYEKN